MSHPAHAYRQFSVQGATPLGLVVMLYDGAIAAMKRAVAAIEARDIQKKCADLNRALAIMAQLEGTLNFAQGGEVAKTLKALYTFARAEILKANIQNSEEILRSLIEKLSSVREAWYQAEHSSPPSPSTPGGEETPGALSPTPEPGSWRTSA
ncbi:MAG: flagellar export chaperone FliS [Terriglobia bacterium]